MARPLFSLSAGDKRTLHQTITEYDETAEKVVKRVHTHLTGAKLRQLLDRHRHRLTDAYEFAAFG